MTIIAYKCKFCGHNRAFECDVPADCPALDLDKWKQMLCCDRCADFERSRRDLIQAVVNCAVALRRARMMLRNKAEALKKIEATLSERLTGITKRFAYVVCKHEGAEYCWEPEFVEQIMRVPDQADRAMNFYRRTIRQSVSQQKEIAV